MLARLDFEIMAKRFISSIRSFFAKCKECGDTREVVVLTDIVGVGAESESGFPVRRPCPKCVGGSR